MFCADAMDGQPPHKRLGVCGCFEAHRSSSIGSSSFCDSHTVAIDLSSTFIYRKGLKGSSQFVNSIQTACGWSDLNCVNCVLSSRSQLRWIKDLFQLRKGMFFPSKVQRVVDLRNHLMTYLLTLLNLSVVYWLHDVTLPPSCRIVSMFHRRYLTISQGSQLNVGYNILVNKW